MADFCSELASDVLKDCTDLPLDGLVQKVLIIPSTALNVSTGVTLDMTNPDELITAISTETGTQGYLIEGVLRKKWTMSETTYTNGDDSTPYFMHSVQGIRIMANTIEARKAVNDLATGLGKYYVIIETNWKGQDNDEAFKFLGYDQALVVPDGGIIDNSNENDGAIVVSLQTPSGLRERKLPRIFLDTDYDTTVTAVWDNQLATP